MKNKLQKIKVFSIHIIISVVVLFFPLIGVASPTSANQKIKISTPAVAAVAGGAAVDAATSLNPTSAIDDAPIVPPAPVNQDPFEGLNRAIFAFNEKADQYALKPVANVYNTIMPKPLNEGIHNFFNNFGQLPTIANDILQLNFYQAANDSWRFIINSTIGVLGFFDVASRMGLNYYANDFGLTMARYGWKNSTYLVLPLFGPSTIRDTIEVPVDYSLFSLYPYVEPQSRRYIIYGVGVVDRRAQLLQYQGVFEEVAIDKYVFMRNAYMQRRAHQIEEVKHLSYQDQKAARAAREAAAIETASGDVTDKNEPDVIKEAQATARNE